MVNIIWGVFIIIGISFAFLTGKIDIINEEIINNNIFNNVNYIFFSDNKYVCFI